MRGLRIRQAVERLVTVPDQLCAPGFAPGLAMRASWRDFLPVPAAHRPRSTSYAGRRPRTPPARLRQRKIRAIFAVDLFNDGLDLHKVDTVLMLHPTESATVFLQQFGRHCDGPRTGRR